MEILQHKSRQMAALFAESSEPFDWWSWDPGMLQIHYLLRELMKTKAKFHVLPHRYFFPCDRRAGGQASGQPARPEAHVLNGEYLDRMERLNSFSSNRRSFLFMGANIVI